MPRYEYEVIACSHLNTSEIQATLNEKARDGWRLVPVNVGASTFSLIMEREAPEPDDWGDQ